MPVETFLLSPLLLKSVLIKMYEDLSTSAANLVLIIFWVIIISMLVWGAWWLRTTKNSK